MLTLHCFCCLFGLFHCFWGVLRCLSQLSIDEVKAGQSYFQRPELQGCHSCHARAVTKVDFKLCCRHNDSNRVQRKIVSYSKEAKIIVRIGAGISKFFFKPIRKMDNGLSFFALEGKIKQKIGISARKQLAVQVFRNSTVQP